MLICADANKINCSMPLSAACCTKISKNKFCLQNAADGVMGEKIETSEKKEEEELRLNRDEQNPALLRKETANSKKKCPKNCERKKAPFLFQIVKINLTRHMNIGICLTS
jgi:hypothetical protein